MDKNQTWNNKFDDGRRGQEEMHGAEYKLLLLNVENKN